MNMQSYWFKSSKFDIEPGEDDETNPRIYGRQLAAWLEDRLIERGYTIEDVYQEDWGRLIVCVHEQFSLWVGCSNVWDYDTAKPGDPPPAKDEVTWSCFATAKKPFWKSLFRKIDTTQAASKLYSDLGEILREEQEITLVSEP